MPHRFEDAVSITRDIYWVGFREAGTRLSCNPYILLDRGGTILFDPGSIPDFPTMMRKVIDVVDPGTIELIVVGHQDPDVAGCLPVLEDVVGRSDLQVAAHVNTHRLIQHLGFRSKPYRVDENNFEYKLPSGDVLRFIHTPYVHSPGAIATYHAATKTLFSSDLFGALSEADDLFRCPTFPQSMDSFHQAYMPSNAVLRHSLSAIKALDLERILPQHGTVIEGADVQVALDHLWDLPCGIDLIGEENK